MTDELEQKLTGDAGHDLLLKHLYDLLSEAKDYEFHDFENPTYAAPKMALADRFAKLRQNVLDGVYDNENI